MSWRDLGRWAITAAIPPPGEKGVSYVTKAIFLFNAVLGNVLYPDG